MKQSLEDLGVACVAWGLSLLLCLAGTWLMALDSRRQLPGRTQG
jgi:hypothetical protein